MSENWIKLHRQILNWEWYSDTNTFRVFMHCLLMAQRDDYKYRGVQLRAGQFTTGIFEMADILGLSNQQVRTALKKLEKSGEINKQSTSRYSIITVNNWNLYQQVNKRITNEQQTNNKRITTKQEERIENKEIVVMGKQPQQKKFIPPSVEEVKEFCKERNNGIDAERFWHYYNSKGWKIGKESMKKWQSAVITWEKQDAKSTANSTDNHIQEAIKRMRERNNG
jgi:predicted transcriptional regulator